MVLIVKNLPASAADTRGLILGLGRSPEEENGSPLQYSCLEIPRREEHVGYSPWCLKELDTTEHASMSFVIQIMQLHTVKLGVFSFMF